MPTYFILDSPIGNFFFVLKRVINFPDERKEHMWNCLVVLKVTNWIIAGKSPKCNNMIYFNAFNLKSEWAIKYITHFLHLYPCLCTKKDNVDVQLLILWWHDINTLFVTFYAITKNYYFCSIDIVINVLMEITICIMIRRSKIQLMQSIRKLLFRMNYNY